MFSDSLQNTFRNKHQTIRRKNWISVFLSTLLSDDVISFDETQDVKDMYNVYDTLTL